MDLGEWGEAVAREEYKKRGFEILDANVFNPRGKRAGEIDFIARSKEAIIFVEVKTRTKAAYRFGAAEAAVNKFKQSKLLKMVKIFLLRHPDYNALRPQIDVCAVEVIGVDTKRFSVRILENAVEDSN